MTAFLDTNVLIALLEETHPHNSWCRDQVEKAKREGIAIISDIVFCEFSVAMQNIDEVNGAIRRLDIERYPVNDVVLFRAGKAFKEYRDKYHGTKLGVLPDFLIGAAAEVEDLPLITANERDFAGYFPKITLICPAPKGP